MTLQLGLLILQFQSSKQKGSEFSQATAITCSEINQKRFITQNYYYIYIDIHTPCLVFFGLAGIILEISTNLKTLTCKIKLSLINLFMKFMYLSPICYI